MLFYSFCRFHISASVFYYWPGDSSEFWSLRSWCNWRVYNEMLLTDQNILITKWSSVFATCFFLFSSLSKYCSILTLVYLQKNSYGTVFVPWIEVLSVQIIFLNIYVCVDKCAATWYSCILDSFYIVVWYSFPMFFIALFISYFFILLWHVIIEMKLHNMPSAFGYQYHLPLEKIKWNEAKL